MVTNTDIVFGTGTMIGKSFNWGFVFGGIVSIIAFVVDSVLSSQPGHWVWVLAIGPMLFGGGGLLGGLVFGAAGIIVTTIDHPFIKASPVSYAIFGGILPLVALTASHGAGRFLSIVEFHYVIRETLLPVLLPAVVTGVLVGWKVSDA